MPKLSNNRFIAAHSLMLSWLGIVVAVALTTAAISGDILFAAMVVAPPALLILGFAAALIEIIQALRDYTRNVRATAVTIAGTIGLGVIGIPVALALVALVAHAARWLALAWGLAT